MSSRSADSSSISSAVRVRTVRSSAWSPAERRGRPGLFRDPYLDPSCLANCNVNIFLVRSLPSLARAAGIADGWFTAAAAFAFIAICTARLVAGSRPARRRLLPVAVPAIMFAAAAAARAVALQRTTVEDPFNAALFTIFAVADIAIVVLAAGLISGVVRGRAEHRAIARIAANLDEAPAPGSLPTALAEALHDPELRIAYWLPGARRYVDASGHEVPEPAAKPGGTVTRLMRNGRTVAAITHSGAAPGLESHLGPAITLGLENERLQAELLAQLGQLRASRARIVETADAERRRLERDLHDGAQQHLLALSYDIRLAWASAEADGDTDRVRGVLVVVELAVGTRPARFTLPYQPLGGLGGHQTERQDRPCRRALRQVLADPGGAVVHRGGQFPQVFLACRVFGLRDALRQAL